MFLNFRSGFLLACLAFCFSVFPFHFAQGQGNATSVAQEPVSSMSVQELRKLIKENVPVLLLDVRRQEEYDAGHLDNAALIPLDSLEERYAELPKDKRIVVYCRSGKRSAMAADILQRKGYGNSVSLSGGYAEWENQKKQSSRYACYFSKLLPVDDCQ